jgi:predicted nucleic acid-binding protein
MSFRIYLETSVVSYLTARPSGNTIIAGHQASTQDLWEILGDEFEPYVSGLVLQESSQGDENQVNLRLNAIRNFTILDIDEEVMFLTDKILEQGAVPSNSPEDAIHIAVAAVNEMDMIVTWNFKHINNPTMKFSIREALGANGYKMPEICSPDELLGGLI